MAASTEHASAAAVMPLTWVVGAGGLLGSHLVRALPGRGLLFEASPIPWGAGAEVVLADNATRLLHQARELRAPWRVLWCAGSGVTGATRYQLDPELRALEATLEALSGAEGGSVFLASSVGGIYAGNPAPPFDEFSDPQPLAEYGWAKLEAERMVTQWSAETGTPTLLGRITNLYGPGQNLDKAQGLISQLCLNHVTRRPSSIWVNLDTLRDYVFVPDCADMILDAMDRLAVSDGTVIKILGSGEPRSISSVLGEIRRVAGRKPDVLIGSSPNARFQVRDLSVRSVVWPELGHRQLTPFGVGVAKTFAEMMALVQAS